MKLNLIKLRIYFKLIKKMKFSRIITKTLIYILKTVVACTMCKKFHKEKFKYQDTNV